ncbi:MAG TPA: gephyrin-like molybdotransferase Glp [Solirubrobacteraceae bacterium]|nr:gephyrin-like molybdotransferase Glp [Solirubrobacteraceae bacterium]
MRTIEEALDAILTPIGPLEAAREPLAEAAGRVAAEDVPAAVDLPPFDRSAMDGYAVRAADTAPGVALRLAGGVAAGEVFEQELAPGTAAAISTGAALPPGADAILQSELAEARDGTVAPARAIEPGRHVRYRGEDVRAGDVLARAGERLTLPRLSALASAGVGEVAVHRRPRLHLLVTGSELLPLGAPPEPGRIHESNGLMVSLLARRAGAELIGGGVVPDDRAATLEAVERGLSDDVLVVSGGVSVGPHDHVKPAFEACGVEEVLWRVRIKPGKPMWFGRRGSTLVFGLPGNPLSGIVCFCVFIEPALRRLQGERDARPRLVRGRIMAPAEASDQRTTFLTAAIAPGADGVLEATPTERQGSHMTGALGESDGFAVAPHGAPALQAGDPVDLLLLG